MASAVPTINLEGTLWLPYKELYQTVDSAIYKRDPASGFDLENALKKHKLDFTTVLQYPPKSDVSRNAVQKACTEGIAIHGQPSQVLTKQFVEEALLVSDLFELNEVMALELIIAGESQLCRYPGLTRGLVAVLLYYDGQRCLVASLRSLIQARRGDSWTLGLSDEVTDLCTRFTDELWQGGLCERIIEQLQNVDVNEIRKKLSSSSALGNPRHRAQVMALVVDIGTVLAECIFCWSCQSSLSLSQTLRILEVLSKLGPVTVDSSLDGATLALIMSVLYSFDSTALDRAEDIEAASESISIVSDRDFVPNVHKRLTGSQQWEWPAMKMALQFAWVVTLRNLSQIRDFEGLPSYIEDDETLIGEAIQGGALRFLTNFVVEHEKFHLEEFYVHRLHTLVTDFIVRMPLKIKDLRNLADETSRIILSHTQEGIVPPRSLPHHFEELLQLITSLYEKDPLGLKLSANFWHPSETQMESSNSLYSHWPSDRQINLYKFVRLAGDLLPQALYVPYVTMLNGLSGTPQTAHNCYNLLKLNGTNAGGKHSNVSWDHFFLALNCYYSNMRMESPLISDTHHLYQQRGMPRGITPQELEALVAVLRLVRTVVSQDELARVAFFENNEWVPQVVLFGLLACSVPPVLKEQLLLTLAAFARSPEISASIWQLLEASQVFCTVQNLSGRIGGIQTELEEVESRNEEYPITCAFLQLLVNLADSPNPGTLGLGHRAPGYEPFLQFVINSVLLNFTNRAYRHAEEKWKVSSLCLELLHKLLCQHDITVDDFHDVFVELHNGGSAIANKKPAFRIIINMLHNDRMLKMIFSIIDDVTGLLDQYVPFPGKDQVEKSGLYCLKLLDSTLEKQDQFMSALRESGSSLLVTSLDQLLQGINPRTRMADHLTKIAKFVIYNDFLPEHSYVALKILSHLAKSAVNHAHLLSTFTAKEQETATLCHGFVECLEAEDDEETNPSGTDQDSQGSVRCGTRRLIVRFLITSLKHSAPNVAHLLLGFNWRKPLSKSVLQDPGVLGSPYTCLHAAIDILFKNWNPNHGSSSAHQMPETCELCYQLIYALCASQSTCDVTLRYLRSSHDFLHRQLQVVPLKPRAPGKSAEIHLRRQQAWLLKTVAIELRVTVTNLQRSHLQRLLVLLIDDSTRTDESYARLSSENAESRHCQSGRKLLRILHELQFSQQPVSAGRWEYFDNAVVEQTLSSCEREMDNGVTVIDVSLLHKTFDMELASQRGSLSSPQYLLFVKEVQAILKHAAERNEFRQSLYSKQQAFESWRQVTEVILTSCPQDAVENFPYTSLLLDMTHVLLQKVKDPTAIAKLSNAASGVVMVLMATLRQCFMKRSQVSQQFSSTATSSTSQNISLSTFSSSLLVVLKGLLECVAKIDGSQNVRAHYYTALLNVLKMTDKATNRVENPDSSPESDENADYEKLKCDSVEAVLSFGEILFEVTSWDSCNARNICKMLSLVCMLEMLPDEKPQPLVQYLVSNGYLRDITDGIVREDERLQAAVQEMGNSFQSLYVFEAKMAFLIQMANSSYGSMALLDNGALRKLMKMNVFDIRPVLESRALSHGSTKPGSPGDGGVFFPDIEERYSQIMLPTLQLCVSMVMVLGPHGHGAKLQVIGFLSAHLETFVSILRARPSINDTTHLKVLSLTTALIANALGNALPAEHYSGDVDPSIVSQENLTLLQRDMLFLLPHFVKGEGMCSSSASSRSRAMGMAKADVNSQLLWLEVTANLLTYCKSVVMRSGPHSRLPGLVFSLEMDDTDLFESTATAGISKVKDFSSFCSTRANLGIGLLVLQLQRCSVEFTSTQQCKAGLARKLRDLLSMNEDELSEVAPQIANLPSVREKREAAGLHLLQEIDEREKVLGLLSYMLEMCVFLLWHHLHFYLILCVPSDSIMPRGPSDNKERSLGLRRLQDFSQGDGKKVASSRTESGRVPEMRITQEDLNRLKSDCQCHITGVLLSRLDDIAKADIFKLSHNTFMEAMVRRLRRLVTFHTKLS